jgi:hypothetical protein
MGFCAPHTAARASTSTTTRPAATAAATLSLPDRECLRFSQHHGHSLRRAALPRASARLKDHDRQLARRDRLVVLIAAVQLDEPRP